MINRSAYIDRDSRDENIVIFDICDTLFASNTTFDFLAFYMAKNRFYKCFTLISRNILARMLNAAIFRLFHIDIIRKMAIRFLTGRSRVELLLAASLFYDDFLSKKKRDSVFMLLNQFREQHFSIYLVSGTLDFIAETIGEKLGISDIFSTCLLYRQGICTGKIDMDLLGDKERLLSTRMDLSAAYVVTDNVSDKELVKCAAGAYIVSRKKNIRHWHSLTNICELIICE